MPLPDQLLFTLISLLEESIEKPNDRQYLVFFKMCNTFFSSRTVWIVFFLLKFSSEEWVEIPQVGEIKNYKFSTHSTLQTDLLSSILDNDRVTPGVVSENSKPSKVWLDYQKERFGINTRTTTVATRVISSVNKFMVTDRTGNLSYATTTTLKSKSPFIVYDTIRGVSEEVDNSEEVSDEQDHTSTEPSVESIKKIKHRNKIQVTISRDDRDKNDNRSIEDQANIHKTTASKRAGLSKKTKLSSFQRFLEYMRTIQNTFVTKTSNGIKNKIEYLHKFKDHLLFEIEDRVKALWPTSSQKRKGKRSKRSGISHDSFLSFPSAEGALMTINFLTFAVFLIKLVLQVINTIKSKHYSYNGLQVNTMEAIKVSKIRRTRSSSNFNRSGDVDDTFNSVNILNSIENFKEKLKSF